MPDYFTGDQARKAEQTTTGIIKALLEEKLAGAPYSNDFYQFGGVAVIDEDRLAEKTVTAYSTIPTVFLSVDAQKRSVHEREVEGVTWRGERHAFTITAELITSDETFDAERPLRDAIADIISTNKKSLRLAGFNGAECDPNPTQWVDQSKINPLTINGVVYTLKAPTQ